MKILTICFLLAVSTCCLAQDTRYRHSFGVDLGNLGYNVGTGPFLKYDFAFKHSPSGFWNVAAGVGGFGFSDSWHAYSARTSAGFNLGKKSHFLQFGIGAAYTNDYYAGGGSETPRNLHYYIGPQAGYKFISQKRFQFGAWVGVYAGTHTYFPATLSFSWGFGK
jgi:hypothetical protein